MPIRSTNLRAEASPDEAPIGSNILRQLAILESLSNNKWHHVDVDQLRTGNECPIAVWELVLWQNRCQEEGLHSVLVTYLRTSTVFTGFEVFVRKTNRASPVLEKLLPNPPHDMLAAPQLGEDRVLVVESLKENLGDQLLHAFA